MITQQTKPLSGNTFYIDELPLEVIEEVMRENEHYNLDDDWELEVVYQLLWYDMFQFYVIQCEPGNSTAFSGLKIEIEWDFVLGEILNVEEVHPKFKSIIFPAKEKLLLMYPELWKYFPIEQLYKAPKNVQEIIKDMLLKLEDVIKKDICELYTELTSPASVFNAMIEDKVLFYYDGTFAG